ncbi:MAG TPA: hypothetical protein VFT84_10375 [Gemmatimonadales bacterium]|nr:hypothetical protein [Gemmatimonadales bacterium]
MRKLVVGVVALLVGAGLNAGRAVAQTESPAFDFAIGGGVAVPLGDFDDASKLSWHGTAAVRILPQNLPVGFQVDGNFDRLSDESAFDIKSQLIYGTGNVIYRFQTSEGTRFQPYLIGGGGVYNLDAKGDDVPTGVDSQTKFGLNAGAGFDFDVGAAALFLEGRFHNVFTDGSDTQFLPLAVGVRFGGR